MCCDYELKEEEMSSSNLLGDGAVANKAASILNKTVRLMCTYVYCVRGGLYCVVLDCIALQCSAQCIVLYCIVLYCVV